jgi:7-cyano-7-deazaguanine synthase in queuosine biosynthesis
MNKIDSIFPAGVNLDIYEGPIGVSCSGGADSSILLYYLMREVEQKIYICTTGNNQRNRYNVTGASRVVEKLIQLTGNSNIEHHISYCEVQTSEELFPKLATYFKNNTVNIFYTGITSNPPVEVTDKFKLKITEHDRSEKKKDLLIQIPNVGLAYTPWANVDKRKIAEMYKEANLLEELFPLTRSCEYDPTSSFFDKVEDPGMGHCGSCWWCEERQWAFGRLE